MNWLCLFNLLLHLITLAQCICMALLSEYNTCVSCCTYLYTHTRVHYLLNFFPFRVIPSESVLRTQVAVSGERASSTLTTHRSMDSRVLFLGMCSRGDSPY